MNALPLLAAAMLLLATGCIGRETPELEAASVPDAPADEAEPEAEPVPATTAPPAKPTSEPPHTHGTTTNTSANASPPEAPKAAPAPRIDVMAWNLTITGAGVSPPAGPACCIWRTSENAPGQGASFEVPAGLHAIVVELAWTHEQADLDLQVLASDYTETVPPSPDAPETSSGHAWAATDGAPGQPDGRATITITDAEALALTGTWAWRVGAKLAQDVPYTVAVSLFHDAPPGAEYSALATPSDNP